MRRKPHRHFFLNSVLLSAAFFALHTSNALAGEPVAEFSFNPAKNWIVDASSKDAGGMCQISTEFDNGFVLSLSGNDKWIQGLSIDLRQDALEKGKSYKAILNVPGKQKIETSGNAISASKVSISLDGRKALYTAMQDNGVLDVSIEGNDFRFFLVNFAAASADFEQCMAGTSAQNTPLEASASEDPFEEFKNNEAIALEQAEVETMSSKAAQEKISEPPTPLPQFIPYEKSENETPAQNLMADKRSLAENAADNALPVPAEITAPRERLADKINKEIEGNPDLIAVDDGQDQTPVASQKQTTNENIKEELKEAPDSLLELPKSRLAQKPLEVPPTVEQIPLDSKNLTQQDEQEVKQVAPAPPITASAAPQELDKIDPPKVQQFQAQPQKAFEETEVTAENLNAQQLLRVQSGAVQPRPEEPQPVAPTAPLPAQAENFPTTTPMIEAKEIVAEKPITNEPVVAANVEKPGMQPVFEGPFAKRLEKVKSSSVDLSDSIQVSKQENPAATPVQAQPVAIESKEIIRTPSIIKDKKVFEAEADFTNLPPLDQPSIEPAGLPPYSGTNDPDIGRKISELEKMVNNLERENESLKDELNMALSESKTEQASISSQNWNLEQASMRYVEAERQIKVLGQQLARERAQCQTDKKDLETMLFDPQITNQQQMARLAELERQLAEAKAQLGQR